MREIPLSKGYTAIVDDADYNFLSQFKWKAEVRGGNVYATRNIVHNGKFNVIRMHRVILNPPAGAKTDHINGNGLDNRRENLRIATSAQNNCNKPARQSSTSSFKGVCFNPHYILPWRAEISANGIRHILGGFSTELEAAAAYNEMALKLHGEFARLNVING